MSADENKPLNPASPVPRDYQDNDLSLGVLRTFIAGAFGTIAIVMLAMWWLHSAVVDREREANAALPAQILERQIASDKGVMLQRDELNDLRRFRAEQDKLATTYGWVDKDNNIAHIPVERAMHLALERKIFPVAGK